LEKEALLPIKKDLLVILLAVQVFFNWVSWYEEAQPVTP
jgi:hypothetical protein